MISWIGCVRLVVVAFIAASLLGGKTSLGKLCKGSWELTPTLAGHCLKAVVCLVRTLWHHLWADVLDWVSKVPPENLISTVEVKLSYPGSH
ncbi:hypothetical protein XENTR_v10023841 [Xenopus tropicalis]|nr:hypothetical protein XENTR_v10023841 [Xenopus tropicalis]